MLRRAFIIIGLTLSMLISFVAKGSPGNSLANPILLGTPGSNLTCNTYQNFSNTQTLPYPFTNSSISGGYVTVFKFCTNALANCIFFDLTATGNDTLVKMLFNSNLSLLSNSVSGYTQGSVQFSSTQYNLVANSCYYLLVWSPHAGNVNLCIQTILPGVNDECQGAIRLSSTPICTDNHCYTYNPATEPPPVTFCASSGENTAWFVFTPMCNGSVTLNISAVFCVGGNYGFQMGIYTGTCGNLISRGCQRFNGTNIPPFTIGNLIAGVPVYLLIDGDLGASCSFCISATNTIPAITLSADSICIGETTILTASGGDSYFWMPGGATTPSISVSPASTTNYTCQISSCRDTVLSTTVYVRPPIIPRFNAIGPYCIGEAFTMPLVSNNGITGSWSPTINTAQTTTYTFTSDPGHCAGDTSITVIINQPVSPLFGVIGPYCSGTLFTLPSISLNGISGSWSPAINNTQTTNYTFTPDVGQCAHDTTITVVINQPSIPQFSNVSPICSGTTFTLPVLSLNGISGTWWPAINNTQSTQYIFTPNPDQCAATTSTMVVVLQNDTTETNLTVCQAHLPYQWNAAMLLTNAGTYQHHFIKSNGCDSFVILHLNISNIASSNTTINVCQSNAPYLWNGQSLSASGSYSHTFIMGNSCDSIANLQLTITPLIHPDFTQVQSICSGDNFTLPGVSNNGITGSWSPPINNLITTTYLFTPDPGQCGDTNR